MLIKCSYIIAFDFRKWMTSLLLKSRVLDFSVGKRESGHIHSFPLKNKCAHLWFFSRCLLTVRTQCDNVFLLLYGKSVVACPRHPHKSINKKIFYWNTCVLRIGPTHAQHTHALTKTLNVQYLTSPSSNEKRQAFFWQHSTASFQSHAKISFL